MSDSVSNAAALEVTTKIMISAVIVFFMVIILVFLLHLYASCLWSTSPEDPQIVSWRRQLAGQNRPSADVARRQRGLNSSTLKSLPIILYQPKEFKDGLECTICLSELQEEEKIRILPNCSHGFHLECIDKWFHSHSTCPICRASVVEDVSDPNWIRVESRQEEINVSASGQLPDFPTNMLFWGDETRVTTLLELASSEEGVSSAICSDRRTIIDIQMADENCSNPSTAQLGAEEEERSPVVNHPIKSLKRLVSRGKKVGPSTCSSSSESGGVEQV